MVINLVKCLQKCLNPLLLLMSLAVFLSLYQSTCCSTHLTCKQLVLLQLISTATLNHERRCYFVEGKHVKYYNSITGEENSPKFRNITNSLKHYDQALCDFLMKTIRTW